MACGAQAAFLSTICPAVASSFMGGGVSALCSFKLLDVQCFHALQNRASQSPPVSAGIGLLAGVKSSVLPTASPTSVMLSVFPQLEPKTPLRSKCWLLLF